MSQQNRPQNPHASATSSTTIYPPAAIGWYTTVLLALLYWLSILDRTIISLMVDPIKADLGISDVQFGMLHGLAFAITFSVFGLFAGTLADRFSRRVIIFFSVSIWSISTALCGAAHNFWQLLSARIGVGAGEAGLHPCGTSMISDLFPPQKQTLALAVYALGASAGSGCALLFGGMLIDMVSAADEFHLPLVGQVSAWQAVFYIVGVPGIAIAFLSFSMPEPKRLGVRKTRAGQSIITGALNNYKDLFAFIGQRKRFFTLHFVGFGFASICMVSGSAWYPAHLGRTFGLSATEIGLILGVAMVVTGFLGKTVSGYLIDKLYARGYKDAQMRYYGTSMLLAAPAGIGACLTSNLTVFVVLICVFLILIVPFTAAYIASLNLVTPNELRGTTIAFYSSTVGLVTMSLGPVSVAAASDYLFGGNAIGEGLALVMAIACPLGALALYKGMGAMRNAVNEAEQWR